MHEYKEVLRAQVHLDIDALHDDFILFNVFLKFGVTLDGDNLIDRKRRVTDKEFLRNIVSSYFFGKYILSCVWFFDQKITTRMD